MKRKKILFYTMALIKGGTEKTIWNLANHFVEQYDITIVSNINHPIEFDFDSRIKIIMIDTKDRIHENITKKFFTKLGPTRSIQLKKIIHDEKPDLMMCFLPEPTIRLLKLKKEFPHIPIIVAIRNHPKKEFVTFLEKIIRNHYYSYADTILIQDDHFKKYLPKKFHFKIKVIPNYISPSFLHTSRVEPSKKIVTVARLEKQKNIPLLIRVFSKMDSKYSDYSLYIYGEGSLKEKIKKLICHYHLENKIFLCGVHQNIEEEIKDAYLFVLSSNYEGMPNSILEAMSLSLPVLVTNSSDAISTIIKNHENGVIVPKNDEKQFVNELNYLLGHPNYAKKIGKKASTIRDTFSKDYIINLWQVIIEQYLS